MLHTITTVEDKFLQYIKDDPVRPEIPAEYRVKSNRFILAMVDDDKPESMVCISLHDFVPKTVDDLDKTVDNPTTAVFYTIWSYKPGSGAKLLLAALDNIRRSYPTVTNFVTLSPKTEMAKRFHLKNGASIFRENTETVNYQYTIT